MTELIPAIDLMDGKCVRLQKGDFATQKIYANDPLEMAKYFEGLGFKRLHLVDLDGAKAKKPMNTRVLERVASATSLNIDFGGGLRTEADLHTVFAAGAAQVTCGSIAVKEPGLFKSWLKSFGPDRFILAADVLDGFIAVSGWQEASKLSLWEFLDDYTALGINHVLCTDISKDGMLEGPAFALYAEIMQRYPNLFLIASGGVSAASDVYQLADHEVPAVVVGKAIYEGLITEAELRIMSTREEV